MESNQSEPYVTPSPELQTYIDQTLRVTTTDNRFFVGELKCTDRDKNLILAQTSEYRYPSRQEVLAQEQEADERGRVKVDLRSRFIGLVVVPGNVITKIEIEERPPQSRSNRGWGIRGFSSTDPSQSGII